MRLTLLGLLCITMMACATATVSTDQELENTRLIQRGYDAFRAGNVDAVVNMFSPDAEWEIPTTENVAITGRRQGREQIRDFFGRLNAAQEVLSFEPREFIAQGDRVVVLGHYAWRVRSTGRRFESDFAHVYTIRNGQVVRFQEFTDTGTIAAAYRQ